MIIQLKKMAKIFVVQGGLAVNMWMATGKKSGCMTIHKAIEALLNDKFPNIEMLRGLSFKDFSELYNPPQIQSEDPKKFSKNKDGLWNTIEALLQAAERNITHVVWDRTYTLTHALAKKYDSNVIEFGSGQIKFIDAKTGKKETVDFPAVEFLKYIDTLGRPSFTAVSAVDYPIEDTIKGTLSEPPTDGGYTQLIDCLIAVISHIGDKPTIFSTGFWAEPHDTGGTNWDFIEKIIRARLGIEFTSKVLTNDEERELERGGLPEIVEKLVGKDAILTAIHTCGSRTGTTYYPQEKHEVNFITTKVERLGQKSDRW